jgi:predicted nucleic acid-binding protein
VNYLDSSGLVKLLVREHESVGLRRWLEGEGGGITSSELAWVEVMRTVRRQNPSLLPGARAFLSGVDYVPLTRSVLVQAAELGGPLLRSLDAIHVASALRIPDLGAFVAYDRRLLDAAADVGLTTASPY